MSKTILVAYATQYGSTREVAEKLAETLKSRGLEVDLQPARGVRSLEKYGAIVLGAPLLLFNWHKDAMNFIARQRKDLSQTPLAIFALGPAFKGDENEFGQSRKQLNRELSRYGWLKPIEIKIFGGKFNPEKVNFIARAAMRDMPAGDFRDWKAIDAWGGSLAEKFSVLP